MIKKIIYILLFNLIVFIQVYAWIKIELTTSKLEFHLDETIDVQLSISSDNREEIKIISIEWMENFINNWVYNSFNSTIINWISKNEYNLSIKLKALEEGEYNIWPIELKIWDKILHSDIVMLQIINDKPLKNQENIDEHINIKNNINKVDIKDIKKSIFSIKDIIIFPIIFPIIWTIFILIFLLIINKYLYISKNKNNNTNYINQELLYIINWIKNIDIKIEKEDFYNQINNYCRLYLKYNWISNSHTITLKELSNKKLEKKFFLIFTDMYNTEFSDNMDNTIKRKKIKNNLIKYFKTWI